MSPKLFAAAMVILVACAGASAQDPTKVEATHYKLAFENDSVQVVNVHYGPHEKSEMPSHPGGVVVVLTAGHLRFTDQHGNSQEVYAKPGESHWFPPFKHKVENLGDTPYNAVYIGIKTKRTVSRATPGDAEPQMDAQTRKILTDYLLAPTGQ